MGLGYQEEEEEKVRENRKALEALQIWSVLWHQHPQPRGPSDTRCPETFEWRYDK
jgi:hypothetical protein